MKIILKVTISIIFLTLLLSGCASWKANYDFCKKSDWRELGMRDGKNDKKMEETFAKYKMMCKEFDEEGILEKAKADNKILVIADSKMTWRGTQEAEGDGLLNR